MIHRIVDRLMGTPVVGAWVPRWPLAVALVLYIVPAVVRADELNFARQIQPILAGKCFTCHGPDETQRQAGLRLDIAEAAVRHLESGTVAIVPGKATDSEMIRRILSADPSVVMPPPDANNPVTREEKDLLMAWIDQGAHYEQHWAYVAPRRSDPPVVSNTDWQDNPIDRFVFSAMQSQGLQPSIEADRYTLIRRVSLTLTGLPPTIEEVDAFVKDARVDAYERLVDRLLGEPAHGEHLARSWLDVARYADSNGYSSDASRDIWAWRDWVIDALNNNMLFDQFTVEQIAGDLLANATDSQIIATGFHRNTMFNEEDGIDEEEFRTKAVKDRVSTTMTAWMGATMMCCECHDHKYDPLTQKEFYQLYAFFNNVPETGGGRGGPKPFFELNRSADQRKEIDEIEKRLAAAIEERDHARARTKELAAKWEADLKAGSDPVVWSVLDPSQFRSEWGAELKKLDDLSILSTGFRPEREVVRFVAETELAKITAVRVELLPDSSLPAGGSGRFDSGEGAFTLLTATAAPKSDPAAAKTITFRAAMADYSHPKLPVKGLIDATKPGWGVGGATGRRHHAILSVADPSHRDGGTRLRIRLHQELGASYIIGRFRISVTNTPGPFTADRSSLSSDVASILAKPADRRSAAETAKLLNYYDTEVSAHLTDAVNVLNVELDEAKNRERRTMVMRESDEPRKAFVQTGGSFLAPSQPVEPSVPAVFHPLHGNAERQPSRLDLAHWLTDPNNPLMARVTVNRFWQGVFGTGIVSTPEEFGTRGELPTHPILLDWLATEFVRLEWDVKGMLRLLVTSMTFRQASEVTPAMLERDAENRYYTRGPRHRLDGEMVRDTALVVSGLLNAKIGGQSVFPHQTGNLWIERGLGVWPTSTGGALYRRSMYTYWRRAIPHPFLATFDGPSREFCVVKRPRTNTPLQALATLNSKHFAEAARFFADRILKQGLSTDADRIEFAFRCCLARPPQQHESEVLLRLLKDRVKYFRDHGDEAAKVTANGGPLKATGGTLEDIAAWTVVANVLINLDETLTRP